jgi:hypothetical protein
VTLIDREHGERAVCVECRKIHTAKDCPLLEWRIIQALGSGKPYGEKYANIAAELGVSRRRIQQTTGRLMRNDRQTNGGRRVS